MSSIIDNYIHYNRDYYLAFGLQSKAGRRFDSGTWEKTSGGPEKVLEDAHNNIVNYQKGLGNWTKANDLAKKLNFYYNSRGKTPLTGAQLTEEEYKLLEKYALEQVESQLNRTDVLEGNFKHLRFDYAEGKDPRELVGLKGDYINKTGEAKSVRASTIKQRIMALNRAYNNSKFTKGSDIEARVKELIQLDKQLTKDLKQTGEKVYYLQDVVNKNGVTTHTANENALSFVEKYNSLMRDYIFHQAMANGHLGEFMTMGILFMLQQKGNKVTKEITDDMMKNFTESMKKGKSNNGYSITGKDTSHKGLFQANYAINLNLSGENYEGHTFAGDLNSRNNYLEYQANGDAGLISVKATQDKVDAVITMDGEEDLNLSIKNYQSAKFDKVSLHSGSLIRLIQGRDEFINHYLNIATTRTASGDSRHNEKKREWNRTGGSDLVTKAKDIMKEYTFYKALAGGVRTTALDQYTLEANYFVFNDSTVGHFVVIPISAFPTLFKEKNTGGIDIKYNGKPALDLKNSWEKSEKKTSGYNDYAMAFRRMRNLMLSLFSVSTHVSLAIKQITELGRYQH